MQFFRECLDKTCLEDEHKETEVCEKHCTDPKNEVKIIKLKIIKLMTE